MVSQVCRVPPVGTLKAAATCGSVPVRSRWTVPSLTTSLTRTLSGIGLTMSSSR